MKLYIKLKSGALQLVLFIGVILFLLISLLITLHHFNQLNQIDFLCEKEAQVKNIEFSKDVDNLYLKENFTFLGVEGINEKSFHNYGVYELLMSQTELSKNTVLNYSMIGGKPSSTSIVLENHQFGLSISGKTRLEGNIKLPKEGLKAGFVNGKYYYGSTLNYFGSISLSKDDMGEPKNVSFLKAFLSKSRNQNYLPELKIGEIYHNSFSLPTQNYYSTKSIELKNLKLSGNLILESKTEIHVYSTSVLEDVILIAPRIVIHEKTIGTFQAIAEKSILVEKNVELKYPSSLVVNDLDKDGELILEENVSFSGVLMYLKKRDNDFRTVNLQIEKGTKILGDVFCQGGLSIADAEINGGVCTKYFIHKTRGSTYINMLLNTRISNLGIYKKTTGFNWDNNRKVMKWLY